MRHACHRLAIKQLGFVPYGDTIDGSTERLVYREQLAGYLRDSLLPVLASWEGDMPEHLLKVSSHVFIDVLLLLWDREWFNSEAVQMPDSSCPSYPG